MKKLDIERLNKRCSIGTYTSTQDEYGDVVEEYVNKYKVWYAELSMTYNQTLESFGTPLRKTKTIAIRHIKDLDDTFRVKLADNQEYEIVQINQDEVYDMLVLRPHK